MDSYKNVGGPKQTQEVSDEAISLKSKDAGDMRDGKPLEYDYDRFQQARSDAPSVFESIVRRAEIAKAVILVDEAKKALDYYFPEYRLMKAIDVLIAKSKEARKDEDLDDVNKTNLPHTKVKEDDSVSTLSAKEKERNE